MTILIQMVDGALIEMLRLIGIVDIGHASMKKKLDIYVYLKKDQVLVLLFYSSKSEYLHCKHKTNNLYNLSSIQSVG